LGESLVVAARQSSDPAERARLLALVLRRAGDDALDGLRFRVEDDLEVTPLSSEDRRTLASLASSDQSFAKRSFALTVLAGAAPHGGDEAIRSTRLLLDATLGTDPDPALRDLSARLLGRLPSADSTAGLLTRAGREDSAWNVRYTALEALARTTG